MAFKKTENPNWNLKFNERAFVKKFDIIPNQLTEGEKVRLWAAKA